jgi:hypothetical protein
MMMRIQQNCAGRDGIWHTVLILMALHTAVYIATGLNLLCYPLVVDLTVFYMLIRVLLVVSKRFGSAHPLSLCILVSIGVVISDMLPYLPVSHTTLGCIIAVFLFAIIIDLANDFGRTVRQVDAMVYRQSLVHGIYAARRQERVEVFN